MFYTKNPKQIFFFYFFKQNFSLIFYIKKPKEIFFFYFLEQNFFLMFYIKNPNKLFSFTFLVFLVCFLIFQLNIIFCKLTREKLFLGRKLFPLFRAYTREKKIAPRAKKFQEKKKSKNRTQKKRRKKHTAVV